MTKKTSASTAALDWTFPGLWLMGFALALAIGLMIFCAWRIFLLENEAREVASERLLLERDRDEFMTYGGDLPQLVERHKSLELEMRQFENLRQTLQKDVADLQEKKESLRHETGDLMGSLSELRAQKEAITSELAKEQAALSKLRPEGESVAKELAVLRAQEKALNESIAQKQKKEAALAANLEGMERQRAHTQELLTRINQDQENYASFQKTVSDRLAQFEKTLAQTSALNGEYSVALQDLDKFRTKMTNGMETLTMDLQGVSGQLDLLKKERSSWQELLGAASTSARAFQTQVDGVSAEAKRLAGLLTTVDTANKTFQATLLTEAAAINRMASEDAEVRNRLDAASTALNSSAGELKKLTQQLQESAAQIRPLLSGQQGELASVAEAAHALIVQLEKDRQSLDASLQAGTSLNHTAVALADQVENIKNRLKNQETRGENIDNLLAGQSERLKSFVALAKALSAEIDESRRLTVRLQSLMGEIQERLASRAPQVEAVAPPEHEDAREGQANE